MRRNERNRIMTWILNPTMRRKMNKIQQRNKRSRWCRRRNAWALNSCFTQFNLMNFLMLTKTYLSGLVSWINYMYRSSTWVKDFSYRMWWNFREDHRGKKVQETRNSKSWIFKVQCKRMFMSVETTTFFVCLTFCVEFKSSFRTKMNKRKSCFHCLILDNFHRS